MVTSPGMRSCSVISTTLVEIFSSVFAASNTLNVIGLSSLKGEAGWVPSRRPTGVRPPTSDRRAPAAQARTRDEDLDCSRPYLPRYRQAAVARQRGNALFGHAWPGAAAGRAGASFAELSGLVRLSASSAASRQRRPAAKNAGK